MQIIGHRKLFATLCLRLLFARGAARADRFPPDSNVHGSRDRSGGVRVTHARTMEGWGGLRDHSASWREDIPATLPASDELYSCTDKAVMYP